MKRRSFLPMLLGLPLAGLALLRHKPAVEKLPVQDVPWTEITSEPLILCSENNIWIYECTINGKKFYPTKP